MRPLEEAIQNERFRKRRSRYAYFLRYGMIDEESQRPDGTGAGSIRGTLQFNA
jgi:hypothetical protein